MVKRICIICLPRSGSSFIGETLSKICSLTDLSEVFSINQPWHVEVNDDLTLSRRDDSARHQDGPEIMVPSFLSKLRAAPSTQSMLIKILMDQRIYLYMNEIVTTLKQYGFEFIILRRRNTENQLLSFALAQATWLWESRTSWPAHKIKKVTVNTNFIHGLHKNLGQFDNALVEFKISGYNMWYESALEDIQAFTGLPVDFDIPMIKIGLPNPYEQIENAEEVRNLIRTLNGT